MSRKRALVTGGSRGVGRGVVIGLVERDFEVFATGRSVDTADLPGEVSRIRCDHRNDDDTARAVANATADGPLDLVVHSAWGGYESMVENGEYTWLEPFWKQSLHRWHAMMDVGVRTAFVVGALAARGMVAQRKGLIVNISYWAARKHLANVIYGTSKAATDKLTTDMAHELRPFDVAAVSLYPGLVRTEAVLAAAKDGWLDISNSESPEFIGWVVAALSHDPCLMHRSGSVLVAAALAEELGVTERDGTRARALTLETS